MECCAACVEWHVSPRFVRLHAACFFRRACVPASRLLVRGAKQEDGGRVSLTLDLGKGRQFALSGVPGRGPFSVSTVNPFLLDGLFVENLEEIQSQAKRIQVRSQTWPRRVGLRYCTVQVFGVGSETLRALSGGLAAWRHRCMSHLVVVSTSATSHIS